MSRVAKRPILVPSGINVQLNLQNISITGQYGSLSKIIHQSVQIKYIDGKIIFSSHVGCSDGWSQAGTARALVYSMILGVSKKFSKKLNLSGVGYRVSVQNNIVNMFLGYSHPVKYCLPDGIQVETPSSNEIIIKGIDKQLVGQIASNLRAYRVPEPYKGKGIRYEDEIVRTKEAKKK